MPKCQNFGRLAINQLAKMPKCQSRNRLSCQLFHPMTRRWLAGTFARLAFWQVGHQPTCQNAKMPKPKSFVMPAVPPDDKAVACRHLCSVGILAGDPIHLHAKSEQLD
jgi:hypothetical protein